MSRPSLVLLALLVSLALGACSSSEDPDPDSLQEPAANCQSRCESKMRECEAAEEDVEDICLGLCAKNATEEQVQCLETGSCEALNTEMMNTGSVCGITAAAGPVCGDGVCDADEDEDWCPEDCEGGGGCGDGVCGYGESPSTCPADCQEAPAGQIGDSCKCSGPALECEGTENGCKFSLSGPSLSCFVNSDQTASGFCSQSCDPNPDNCPAGTRCTSFLLYYDASRQLWRCVR